MKSAQTKVSFSASINHSHYNVNHELQLLSIRDDTSLKPWKVIEKLFNDLFVLTVSSNFFSPVGSAIDSKNSNCSPDFSETAQSTHLVSKCSQTDSMTLCVCLFSFHCDLFSFLIVYFLPSVNHVFKKCISFRYKYEFVDFCSVPV